jgi:hypothetical protein
VIDGWAIRLCPARSCLGSYRLPTVCRPDHGHQGLLWRGQAKAARWRWEGASLFFSSFYSRMLCVFMRATPLLPMKRACGRSSALYLSRRIL